MAVITLRDPTSIYNSQNRLFREGVELEKGIVITEDFLERNEKFLEEDFFLPENDSYCFWKKNFNFIRFILTSI